MNTDMGWRPKFAATSDNFYQDESSTTRKNYPVKGAEKNIRFHSNRRVGEPDHSLNRIANNTLYGSPKNNTGTKGLVAGKKNY